MSAKHNAKNKTWAAGKERMEATRKAGKAARRRKDLRGWGRGEDGEGGSGRDQVGKRDSQLEDGWP